jgi:hypothetical protein
MSPGTRRAPGSTEEDLRRIARVVFSLDSGIRWVALDQAGCPPRWAWRDSESGKLCEGEATSNEELVDPLLLLLAEGRDDLYGDSMNPTARHLLFVVLAYADIVQIVVRVGRDAHVSVAADEHVDAYGLGTRLAQLLDHRSELPSGR